MSPVNNPGSVVARSASVGYLRRVFTDKHLGANIEQNSRKFVSGGTLRLLHKVDSSPKVNLLNRQKIICFLDLNLQYLSCAVRSVKAIQNVCVKFLNLVMQKVNNWTTFETFC